jgi:hypothetical protein|tara:strand:- start:478 stop:1929 length:1452 start_codon:yes stop_codon:yes gene_type:complete
MARRFNPYLIDRSADYLSNSIQGAVTAFDTQMANIEKSKNELALQDAELKKISSSLSADDEQNFKDDLTDAINAEIDRIYKLGYNSIGRDQTEYLKAQSNLLNGVKDLQEGLAIFDEEGKEYQKIVESGQGQFKISNSTDPKARAFMNNISLNKGNGTKIGYENGNFTLNYNGYSKNISNYMQSRKNGGPATINYVNDPSAEYKAIYDKYASNYEPKLIKIQTEAADGSITTTTRKNYDLARQKIREDLYNDPNLLTSISGDEYQYLSQFSNNIDPNEPFKGTPDQIKKALDAKVNLIMDQYAKENQTTQYVKNLPRKTSQGEPSVANINQSAYDKYERNKWYSKQFALTPDKFGTNQLVRVLNDYAGEDIYMSGSEVGGDANEIYELVPGTASDPTPTPRLFIGKLSESKILNALNKASKLSQEDLKQVEPMFKTMNYFIGEDGTVKYSQKLPTPEDFNNKWSKAGKGQRVLGPDGKYYIKK